MVHGLVVGVVYPGCGVREGDREELGEVEGLEILDGLVVLRGGESLKF